MMEEEDFLSDHNAISFEISLNSPKAGSFRPWKKASWSTFRESLEAACVNATTISTWDKEVVEAEAVKLDTDIRIALDEACPLKPVSMRYKPPPFWDGGPQA